MDEGFSPLELMLFGTFEARIDGISLLSLLSAKSRLLLAFLASNSGRAVATGVIAEAVIPDSQAEDPHEIIKKTVQETRRALGREAYRLSAPAPRMLALNLEGARVDWQIFHAALAGDSTEALHHAVALHCRPFLESESAYWVIGEQMHCLHLRQDALETLFRRAMDRGDIADAANSLVRQLAFELPFIGVKEVLWRELMQCLLQRQEYGLLQYHYLRLQTFLANTAGRACEPETEALYRQIPKAILLQLLQHKDRKKKSALPDSARLPNFPFALLGREEEKRQLKTACADFRLLTVVGIGGMGKTRLAVQAAQEMALAGKDDVGFLDLTLCSPHDLLSTFVTTLGIKVNADAPLYPALRDFLRSRTLLLVLDNCEHLIEAIAVLCADLLQDCPLLRLLATSREALRVEGEQVFSLAPLAFPSAPPYLLAACRETDALRLFTERAAAARPEFQLTSQNIAVAVELCRKAEGLPLAIEMIASQIAAAPLERIAADLGEGILTLSNRRRGVSPRHQTLSATLDWSFNILSSSEQTLLRRLSVFAGGWTLQAAENVCADETLALRQISPLLSDLTAKSLVIMVWTDQETVRFHFLETVRVYALEQLKSASERTRFQERFVAYFAAMGEEAEQQLSGKSQKEWLERVDAEYANFRTSLQISVERDITVGLRLGFGLGRYWETRGYFVEGREWCSALLARTELTDRTVARARVLDIAGWFDNIFGDYAKAVTLLEEGLDIFRVQGEEIGASITLIRLGLVALNLGDADRASLLFEESLAIRIKGGDPRLIAMALLNLGIAASNQSDYSRARSLYEECLELVKQVGDNRVTATCLSSLGQLATAQSDPVRAYALFEESLELLRDINDRYMLRFLLYDLGKIAFTLDDWAKSLDFYRECLALSVEAEVPFHTVHCLCGLANVLLNRQQWEQGVTLWGAAEACAHALSCMPDPQQQHLHDMAAQTALTALGRERYEHAERRGRALHDAAIAYAFSASAAMQIR